MWSLQTQLYQLLILLGYICLVTCRFQPKDVVYAVNCGGSYFKDSLGIGYEDDENDLGTASDFGKQFLTFDRVSQADSVLYQTERYHHSKFGYDLPLEGDGDYVLVLKFSEVYFNSLNSKVFDVILNGHHTVIQNLDIYEQVGRAVAHDEYISFSVRKGKLTVNDEQSDVDGDIVRLEFVKGPYDNPKINAFFLYKGDIEDVPKLPPLPQQPTTDEKVEELEAEDEPSPAREKITSGPRAPNPYEDESSFLLPIIIAVVCVIPVTWCIWKLG